MYIVLSSGIESSIDAPSRPTAYTVRKCMQTISISFISPCYLRACVSATVIDCARSMRARRRVILKLEATPVATPEQIILERMEHEEFWRTIEHLVETAQERTILVESFVLNLPPRVIQKRHP